MAYQILMDHSGDSRHEFSIDDAEPVVRAERRFKELTGKGVTAAVRVVPGKVRTLRLTRCRFA
jgi:hypothetical protein